MYLLVDELIFIYSRLVFSESDSYEGSIILNI